MNLNEHHTVLSAQLLAKAKAAADPEEAHRLIEKARIIDPTNPVVLEQSAMVHRREGRFMECIADLLVARRRAAQSQTLETYGVPDVLRRPVDTPGMDAQGRPLTGTTNASSPPQSANPSLPANAGELKRSRVEVKQWTGILRHVRFFADLAKRTPKTEPAEGEPEQPNPLQEVAKVVSVVHCSSNDLIFAQGDEGHSFYVIFMGVVSITLNHEVDDGAGGSLTTEIVVKRLQAGDSFGEAALAEGVTYRSANARAKTSCVLLSLPKDDYNRITAAANASDHLDRAKHLSLCPIFATWSVGRLADIARRCQVKLYDAHSVIIREDDVVPELFVIKAGVVNLNKSVPASYCRVPRKHYNDANGVTYEPGPETRGLQQRTLDSSV